MDTKISNTVVGDDSHELQKPDNHIYRTAGAPSNPYIFTVLGLALVFGGAIIALILFVLTTPDGDLDKARLEQWKAAHPALYHLAGLVAAALDIALFDVMGWMAATRIALLRHGKAVTERQIASMRLAVQILFMVLFVVAFTAFPTHLPRPNGHFPCIGMALLAVPMLLAAIQLRRAIHHKENNTED